MAGPGSGDDLGSHRFPAEIVATITMHGDAVSYSCLPMEKPKRTIWIPLDADLATALAERGELLSLQVNRAVRNELTRPRPPLTSDN